MKTTDTLASLLRNHLNRAGIKPASLAVKADVNESVLSYLLNDKRSADETTLLAIAKAPMIEVPKSIVDKVRDLIVAATSRRRRAKTA